MDHRRDRAGDHHCRAVRLRVSRVELLEPRRLRPLRLDTGLSAIATAGIIYAYTGFQGPIDMSGEARNARRDVPRAVLSSVSAVVFERGGAFPDAPRYVRWVAPVVFVLASLIICWAGWPRWRPGWPACGTGQVPG